MNLELSQCRAPARRATRRFDAYQAVVSQPPAVTTLVLEAGYFANLSAGRRGRATNSPPQLGHLPLRVASAHVAQKVHSNEQMRASLDSGGKSHPQHSQLGLISSIARSSRRRPDVELSAKCWRIRASQALHPWSRPHASVSGAASAGALKYQVGF